MILKRETRNMNIGNHESIKLINPTKRLWDVEAFQLKALYQADVMDRSIDPVISNDVETDDEGITYVIKLEIHNKYDSNICKIKFPYLKVSGRNSNFSQIENEYKRHLLPQSDFMCALKDVFAYLNVNQIRCQDIDNGYFTIKTEEYNVNKA